MASNAHTSFFEKMNFSKATGIFITQWSKDNVQYSTMKDSILRVCCWVKPLGNKIKNFQFCLTERKKLCDRSNIRKHRNYCWYSNFILFALIAMTMYYTSNLWTVIVTRWCKAHVLKMQFFYFRNKTQSDSTVSTLMYHQYTQNKFA